MKVFISYPPLESKKGIPLLSQNRQFQWFSNPCYIYPIVPAQAATLLSKNGFEVVWDDAIAEKKTYCEWFENIKKQSPDLIVIETKTPVIKRHWEIINEIKSQIPSTKSQINSKSQIPNSKPMIGLVGDHVTALPEESFKNSKVDFVLTGGDYDFLLLSLCNFLKNTFRNSKLKIQNSDLESGIYYRENNEIKNTGHFQLNHNLNSLPFIDRDLTKWQLYAYDNGNYKRRPGTYIMAGRDCWWGKCAFCSWTTIYPNFRVRSVENVLDEIGILIEKYKVKEIMDDTGTFPAGKWLKEFCQGMIQRGYNKKIFFDCNVRAGILTQEHYNLMAKANFRFLLYGLESANQETLDRINKGTRVDDIIKDCQMAKRAGENLQPHATCMIGYPWETKQEARKTIELTKYLFKQGLIDTLQATIVIPYPGTPLFRECNERGLLKTKDWDRYDMKEPVMKTEMSNEEILKLTQGLYKSFITFKFIFKKILSIRNLDDLKFFWRAAAAVFGHLKDFTNQKNK